MADESNPLDRARYWGDPARKQDPLVETLMGLRDRIPENTEHSLSLANMLRSGLGTAAGWMDWRNKLSPDDYSPQEVMAPLGAAALTAPFAPRNAVGAFGGRAMSNGKPTIDLSVRTFDPNGLVFREAHAGNLSAVRKLYPEGAGYDPIVVARTKEGPLILDGHNRATIAMERGQHLPGVEIPESVYKKLADAGFDETDIAHAILARAGEEDAARGIRQKFPGVRFDQSEDSINAIIDGR